MKSLSLFLFVFVSFFGYNQYCPALGPDQILPCGVGSTTLTADLSQCGPGGLNPNQTTNYSVAPIPYVAQVNNGTNLFMTDDSQQGPFNIGFTFCFFGTTYTQFYVGSNGWISFSGGQPTTFTTQTLPTGNALVPKNCIMSPWQDWHPGIGGQIKYQTVGTAPCRKLIVSWIGVPMFSCTGNQGTFHIVLNESSNYIDSYIQSKPACLQWQGGTATQGIHNIAGTVAVTVPGRNSTVWTANNDAWRWTPSGPVVTPTLTWYQVGNPVAIGTGPSITVTPITPTQYTCKFVYPICNAGWSSCNAGTSLGPDTVLVVPGPPIPVVSPINASDTVCFPSNDEIYSVVNQPWVNYLWSSVGTITSGQGTNSITVDWGTTSPGFVPGAVMVTPEANGCIGIPVSFDLTILNIIPVIDPAGPFCSNDEFSTLNATPIGGVFSGTGMVGADFYPTFADTLNNSIVYTYTQSGCVFDDTIDIIVYEQPQLSPITPYNEFFELCDGDSIPSVYSVVSTLSGGYNEWTLLNNTIQSPTFSTAWNTFGMFTLSVVNYVNGCPSPQQQTVITIVQCPNLLYYVPNSFTPDGDEHNNTFKWVFTSGFDPYNFHILIFNRWGEVIYESKDSNDYWDGTYNNTPCPAGAYTYKLQFKDIKTDGRYQFTGNVRLLR
jgi:gliding motility-associated-like protein